MHRLPPQLALMSLATMLLAVLTGLSLSTGSPKLALIPLLIVGADALLLVLWRPWTAVAIGLAMPFGHALVPPLAVYGVILLLVAATATAWPTAPPEGRRGARLVLLLTIVTVFVGLVLGPLTTSTSSTVVALVYAGAMGIAAATIRPGESMVIVSLGAIGCVAALSAMANPALTATRTTVVLGENANGIGFLTAVGLVAGLAAADRGRLTVRLVALAVSLLCGFGLFLTGSRGVLVAAALGASTLVLNRLVRGPSVRAVLALGGLVLAAVAFASTATEHFAQLAGRDSRSAYANVVAREMALQYAIEQGTAHPLTGVGLGQLADVARTDPKSGVRARAHNLFAGVFAETGIFTLLALFAVCGTALLRAWRHSARRLMPLVVAVLGGGMSLEWWGASRTGPVAMFVLGSALGLSARHAGTAPK